MSDRKMGKKIDETLSFVRCIIKWLW